MYLDMYITTLPIPLLNYIPFTWPRQFAVTHRPLLYCNALVLATLNKCIHAYKHTHVYDKYISIFIELHRTTAGASPC